MTGTAPLATPASPDRAPKRSNGHESAAPVSAHVAGLDGIRGLAVVAVVAYHLGYGWAKGGYLGVDTFLVLSGYLITSGLLADHRRHGRIRLRAFWGRRLRRLVPALLVVLGAAGIYAAIATLPDTARSLRLDALSALGFVANWRFIASSQGYFGQSAAPSLLRHTWSLGVEAQLYLVWPLIVLAVLHRGGGRGRPRSGRPHETVSILSPFRAGFRRETETELRAATAGKRAATAGMLAGAAGVAWIAAALAIASATLAIALGHGGAHFTRVYYGTDTRAAAFLAGAALAAVMGARGTDQGDRPERRAPWSPGRSRANRLTAVVGLVGAGVTGWLWYGLDGTSPWLFRGGLALAAIASLAVVINVVAVPHGPASRILSVAPLRLLGRVSYGIYLWHWPLFGIIDHRHSGLSGLGLVGARLGATALATALSWAIIERPVLGQGPRAIPRPRQGLLAAGLALAVAAGIFVPVATASAPRPVLAAATSVAHPSPSASSASSASFSSPAAPAEPQPPAAAAGPPLGAAVLGPVRALVLGDSIAVTLANGLGAVSDSYGVRLNNGAIVGCGVAVGTQVRSLGQVSVVPGRCPTWETLWQAALDQFHPEVSVILLGRWELLDRVVDGRWQHLGEPSFDDYVSAQLDRALELAEASSPRVVLCTAPYFRGVEQPDGGMWPENDPVRLDRYNALARAAAARHPGVQVFDLNALMSPGGHYADTVEGQAVRSSDGVHFSPEGGAFIAARLLPLISSLGAGAREANH